MCNHQPIRITLLFSLTVAALLLAVSVCGQPIPKEMIKKLGIKSITTIDADQMKSVEYFNDRGDITRVADVDGGTIKLRKEYRYNHDGLLEEEITYSMGTEIHRVVRHYYNGLKRKTKTEFLDPDKVSGTITFEYDEKGKKKKETKRSGSTGNSETTFIYSDTLLMEQETMNETIGKEEKVRYKYDREGRLVKKTGTYFFSRATITERYTYDSDGRLIKVSEKASNGVSSRTIYLYDERGLLTADIWTSSLGKTPHRTTYIIEF